jgi:hypothetical protein
MRGKQKEAAVGEVNLVSGRFKVKRTDAAGALREVGNLRTTITEEEEGRRDT